SIMGTVREVAVCCSLASCVSAAIMPHETSFVQALSSLPHGPEFRFIDELTALKPGESAGARWSLKGDEEFLRGHFPGHPLLPGVIMIEALAQLGGIIAQTRPGIEPLKNLRLTAVRQFKILGSISPGQSLLIEATLEGALAGVIQVSGTVSDEAGQRLATGVIVLAGQE
ncbi:MAG: putative (3R)-hydroxymyristoyl-[acyl-carrier-protein] dehydratase, partial [Verrucomicrobiaceae bacterium]|nr:putative (3R)-hydroxymyristoyl-[acyl-carrier-protein] dehydratase [Verrucomicrobiaceae bacterium]